MESPHKPRRGSHIFFLCRLEYKETKPPQRISAVSKEILLSIFPFNEFDIINITKLRIQYGLPASSFLARNHATLNPIQVKPNMTIVIGIAEEGIILVGKYISRIKPDTDDIALEIVKIPLDKSVVLTGKTKGRIPIRSIAAVKMNKPAKLGS